MALRSLAATPAGVPVLWVLTARTGAGGLGVQEPPRPHPNRRG